MDRKARNSVPFGPSIRGGTGSGRPTSLINPTGRTHRHLGRALPGDAGLPGRALPGDAGLPVPGGTERERQQ
jgi:hypothetical protein